MDEYIINQISKQLLVLEIIQNAVNTLTMNNYKNLNRVINSIGVKQPSPHKIVNKLLTEIAILQELETVQNEFQLTIVKEKIKRLDLIGKKQEIIEYFTKNLHN